MKQTLEKLYIVVAIVMIFSLNTVKAEDTDALSSSGDETITSEETSKYSSREDLIQYLSQSSIENESSLEDSTQALNDANPDAESQLLLNNLEQAKTDLANAETEEETAAAQDSIDTITAQLIESNPDNEILLTNLSASEKEQNSIDEEITGIQDVVEQLSDEQVVWMNQKLNNAVASGLVLDIPLEELEKFTEYNFHQINMATKAYESEAKFSQQAEKFDADSAQYEKFTEKADTQRDKFLARVDKFEGFTGGKKVAKEEATKAAKDDAKAASKSLALQAAKNAAKQSAKEEAKQNAKNTSKQIAKQLIREEGKNVGKAKAKDKAKDKDKS